MNHAIKHTSTSERIPYVCMYLLLKYHTPDWGFLEKNNI